MLLVTGGAGFIGGHFVRDWLKVSDEPIINLDKLTYAGNRANLDSLAKDKRHTLVEGDIADPLLIQQLLDQYQPRAIINFAAETHVDRSIDGPAPFIHSNINGTFNLLEAARQYLAQPNLPSELTANFRFLQISTDEVFGDLDPQQPPATELSPYQPSSPYAASKASADHLVRAYHRTYGLPILITNCTNNYGTHQYPEKLIPVVLRAALTGKPLPIYGDGQQRRDWLHVGDHCAAIRRVLEAGTVGESYNVGGDCETTNLTLVELICDQLDQLQPRGDGKSYRAQIAFITDRPGHDRRYSLDSSKLQRELGWKPKHTLAQGLAETLQWYIARPAYLQLPKQESVA